MVAVGVKQELLGMTTLALPPELCVHWDKIVRPHGPISIGRCQKCGREREYRTPYNGTIYNNAAQKFPKIALARAEDWE